MTLFSVERQYLQPLVQESQKVLLGLTAGMLAGVVIPMALGSAGMPKPLKTLLLSASFGCGVTATLLSQAKHTNQNSKIYQAIETVNVENLKQQMAYSVGNQQLALEVQAKNQALRMVMTLPPEQQMFWLQQWGLEGMVAPVQTIDVQSSPTWSTSTPVSGALTLSEYSSPETKAASGSMDWLYKIVELMAEPQLERRRFGHLIINGPSQSGKSTLFSKILELLIRAIASHGGKVEICLCDPKYPMSLWPIPATFKGFGQVVNAVNHAISVLDQRKAEAIAAAEAGREMPVWSRFVFIIDEQDTVYGKGKGFAGIISREQAEYIVQCELRLLKEAAAYNIQMIVIGQSPLSESCGFSRSDANQACRIVLGKQALQWTQDPGFVYKAHASVLQQEINACLDNGMRVALVEPNSEAPFVSPIPRLVVDDLSQWLSSPTPVAESETPGSSVQEAVETEAIADQSVDSTDEEEDEGENLADDAKALKALSKTLLIQNQKNQYAAFYSWLQPYLQQQNLPDKETLRTMWKFLSGVTVNDAFLNYLLANIRTLGAI
jgi:hypothetical protein